MRPLIRLFRRNAAPSTEGQNRTWREFRKNRPARLAVWVISLVVLVALSADFLAYNKPIYARFEGKTYFPIFNDYFEALGFYQWEDPALQNHWRDLPLESALWPPVVYLPAETDLNNANFIAPGGEQTLSHPRERHFLGTDKTGRDVLSGLLHGARVSLTVGIVSVGISALIGILLGAFAGYFGDNRLRVTRARLLGGFAGTVLGFFYAFQVRAYTLSDALGSPEQSFLFALSVSLLIFVGCIFLGSQALRPLERIPALAKQVAVGADLAISRLIEVMVSIPTLLLIVSIAAIAEPSLYLVMVVIGLTTWTGIARFTRAEFLRVRNLEYVQAAQAQGFGELRIIFRHALPNAIAPVFIAIAFGVAAAVLVESSLSFLGIGVPPTTVTWGSLLSSVREKFDAWWLAVFPGFAIFLTVTCFNLLGEGLRDALDPRLRS